jgi:CRISPR-associated protein Csb2
MALAAAYFETGEDDGERAVLEWLERLPPPSMVVPDAEPRDIVTSYVPPNDYELPKGPARLKPSAVSDALAIVPLYRTNKQPRTFPRVRIDPLDDDAGHVYLLWPDTSVDEQRLNALDRLCRKVTRVGHSSSLVQAWVVVPGAEPAPKLVPAEWGEYRARVAGAGMLDYLRSAYNREAIEAHADLEAEIAASRGQAKEAPKQDMAQRFGQRAPTTLRPTIRRWQAYRRAADAAESASSGAFDARLMIFSIGEGPVIGLASTWTLLTALRDTIIKTCEPVPEWVSGHRPDEAPTREPHLALMPLAFVDHQHADGHLLGVALAFPKGLEPRERAQRLRKLLYDDHGLSHRIKLVLGSLGDWTLSLETRDSPPRALQSDTWTGPSRTWATVTPIVLDRHPKIDRARDRQRWVVEVAEIVTESCRRQALPAPVRVDIDKTCWHRGAPRATAGGGGGFPLMPVKQAQPMRQQVHAWLQFDRDIEGPLLLGAGRFRGYGVCKPWTRGERCL